MYYYGPQRITAEIMTLSFFNPPLHLDYQVTLMPPPTFFAADNATSLISVNTMHEHPVECITVNSNGWNYLVEPDAISNGIVP